MTTSDAAPRAADARLEGTRVPTSIGFVVGVLSFLAEFVVAYLVGSLELSALVPLAYLVFAIYAAVAMGFAPSRPFQRGFTSGLAVAVLAWLTLFDTNGLDVAIFLILTIIGWLVGLDVSRRRGRLPAELPPTGRRRGPGDRGPKAANRQRASTRRQ